MSISQINVFVQSQPGHIARILAMFERAGVNVRGFSASDTGEYGIVRFIVDDPEKALLMLKEEGAACSKNEVLCAKLDDTPGELARVMGLFASCGINVTYCYSMISTYIVVSAGDIEEAERLLADERVTLLDQDDVAHLSAGESVQ